MTYILEKKTGESPHFYEDAWQPRWEQMKRNFLDYGDLPNGYEALCITQDQHEAAAAVMCVFGKKDHETENLRLYWPHLDWDRVEDMAREME